MLVYRALALGGLVLRLQILSCLVVVESFCYPQSRPVGFRQSQRNNAYTPLRMPKDDLVSDITDRSSRPHKVSFVSPLLDYGYPPTVEDFQSGTISNKPILLYLPGFDGTYICPFIQFPELAEEFEVWCMTVGMGDRSTFDELRSSVLDFIQQLGQAEPASQEASDERSKDEQFLSSWLSSNAAPKSLGKQRPLYLAGESFGGILSLEVALSLLEKSGPCPVSLQGLTLINAATCYEESPLAAKGPEVASLPAHAYPIALSGLLPLFTDDYSFAQLQLILQAERLPSVIDNPQREAYMGRVAVSLPSKLDYMDQGTFSWRLSKWLTEGCSRMKTRIFDFQKYPSFRTLIIVGEKDLTLPSTAEAERLVKLLPKVSLHVVEGAGHASTCGSRMDMAAQLRDAFSELQKGKGSSSTSSKRTAMKPEAAKGAGPYFGMEERYDGASIGLNPMLYWSKEYFRTVTRNTKLRQVPSTEETDVATNYSKSIYEVQ